MSNIKKRQLLFASIIFLLVTVSIHYFLFLFLYNNDHSEDQCKKYKRMYVSMKKKYEKAFESKKLETVKQKKQYNSSIHDITITSQVLKDNAKLSIKRLLQNTFNQCKNKLLISCSILSMNKQYFLFFTLKDLLNEKMYSENKKNLPSKKDLLKSIRFIAESMSYKYCKR